MSDIEDKIIYNISASESVIAFFFSDISAKTQFLLALVYTTKYLDAFTACMTAYSIITKGLSILITYSTLMTTCYCYRKSYENKHDTYR